MVKEIIIALATDGKRVVVPDFGAFIAKDGEVVFVEFLKRDDGLLRDSVASGMALDGAAAMAQIEQFVSQVKGAVSSCGHYPMGTLGSMMMDDNGVYVLRAATAPREVIDMAADQTSTPQRSSLRVNVAPRPAAPRPVAESAKPLSEPPVSHSAPSSTAHQAAVAPPSVAATSGEPRATSPTKSAAPEGFAPQQRQSVNGLRYGTSGNPRPPVTQPKRVDSIMIVAIVVAMISIGVMIFGMMSDSAPTIELVEHPVDTTSVE